MNWKDKKVIITGAGGFIGSHLTDELIALGAEVSVILRYTSERNKGNLNYIDAEKQKGITFVYGNIEDGSFINNTMKDQDIIFHLAALIGIPYSYHAPSSYVSTNINGTLNILEASKIHKPELTLVTSTSEVYGTAQYTPIDEKHPLVGQSPYSATKIGADKLAESYYLSFDLPIGIVRPFNTFGPRQSTRAVIPTIITQALNSNEIHLGDLSTTRDYVYVKDTVQGFIKLAENPILGAPVNLATGEEHSIGGIADTIIKLANPDAKIIQKQERMRPNKSEVRQLIGDNSIAQKQGWTASYSFIDGLKETIDWFREHKRYSNDELGMYVT